MRFNSKKCDRISTHILYNTLKKDRGKMDASLIEKFESILKDRGLDLEYAKSRRDSFGASGFVMGLHGLQFGLLMAGCVLMSIACLFGEISYLVDNPSFYSEDIFFGLYCILIWAFTYLLFCYMRAFYSYYKNIVRFAIIINVLNFIQISALGYFANDYEIDYTILWSALIVSALWITYFTTSKRVKNTFILESNPFRFGRSRVKK